jgi:transcriptional regulator with XRE-family HTH domain
VKGLPMKTIGKIIEELLQENDMTQRELAEMTGVTEATISRYVNETREPRSHIVKKIADIFNISTDYLHGKEEKRKDSSRKMLRLTRKLEELNMDPDDAADILDILSKAQNKKK